MKTKSISYLFLLIFINLLFISCKETTTDPNPGPVKLPKEIISVERASEMYESYSSRRIPIIKKYEDSVVSATAPFTPTRYAEYDLETIKQYIAYIEYQSKQAKVDVKTLRFYLSNYPNSDKFANGDKVRYPRRNSFFVLPTMEHNGENVGFSVAEVNGKFTAIPISKQRVSKEKEEGKTQSISQEERNQAGFFMGGSTASQRGTSSLILNDGTMMPPPGKDDFGNTN